MAARYNDPEDITDVALADLFDRPGGSPPDDEAVYVHVDHWVFMADSDNEDLNRELLAEFPPLSEECAQAADTVPE